MAITKMQALTKTRFVIKLYKINGQQILEIKPLQLLELKYYSKNPLSIYAEMSMLQFVVIYSSINGDENYIHRVKQKKSTYYNMSFNFYF